MLTPWWEVLEITVFTLYFSLHLYQAICLASSQSFNELHPRYLPCTCPAQSSPFPSAPGSGSHNQHPAGTAPSTPSPCRRWDPLSPQFFPYPALQHTGSCWTAMRNASAPLAAAPGPGVERIFLGCCWKSKDNLRNSRVFSLRDLISLLLSVLHSFKHGQQQFWGQAGQFLVQQRGRGPHAQSIWFPNGRDTEGAGAPAL